ncbi:unnamed protein product, partial [marine sediment metagenome]
KKGHFCRWSFKNDASDPNPKRVVYKPVFQWVPV